MARPVLYYLIGYPGVGKHTVGSAMVALADPAKPRLVLVDNHYINNPIFGLLDVDGHRPLPPGTWEQVSRVGRAVRATIRDLSPREWSFVLTNYLGPEASEQAAFEATEQLARDRDSVFLPVLLRCASDEHLRRFGDPARADRLKWRDRGGLRRMVSERGQLQPLHPNLVDLDVTDLTPTEAAEVVLRRGWEISAEE